MIKPEIRYATERDLKMFWGKLPGVSVRAIAVLIEDRVVAVAGLAIYPEGMTAFSEMRDELRPYKVTIMKTGIKFMQLVKDHGANVKAIASPDEPNSMAFLERLGFTHCGDRLWKA